MIHNLIEKHIRSSFKKNNRRDSLTFYGIVRRGSTHSASIGHVNEPLELFSCFAVIDGSLAQSYSLRNRVRGAADVKRRSGVEEHDVPFGTLLTLQDSPGDRGALFRVTATDLLQAAPPQTQL